jgi:hypothetical protein
MAGITGALAMGMMAAANRHLITHRRAHPLQPSRSPAATPLRSVAVPALIQ